MSSSQSFLFSTIGRKYLVALTAIVWTSFILVHMLGNLLIFKSADAYNAYAHALISNPLIYAAEAFLVVTLLLHALIALGLALRNKRSKPKYYSVAPADQKSSATLSRFKAFTGSFILFFIIYHLVMFKYGPYYETMIDGVVMRDLYALVVEEFKNPAIVSLYIASMFFLFFHLFHGVQSIFQTLGFNHPRYNNSIKYFGIGFSVFVVAGFIAQPLYLFLMRV